MNLKEFQDINFQRSNKWVTEKWSLLEWAGAMCGESGECANIAKKIKRINHNLPNKEAGIDNANLALLKIKMAEETTDSIIYGLIILSELGVDAEEIIRLVFDQKSMEYGFS